MEKNEGIEDDEPDDDALLAAPVFTLFELLVLLVLVLDSGFLILKKPPPPPLLLPVPLLPVLEVELVRARVVGVCDSGWFLATPAVKSGSLLMNGFLDSVGICCDMDVCLTEEERPRKRSLKFSVSS